MKRCPYCNAFGIHLETCTRPSAPESVVDATSSTAWDTQSSKNISFSAVARTVALTGIGIGLWVQLTSRLFWWLSERGLTGIGAIFLLGLSLGFLSGATGTVNRKWLFYVSGHSVYLSPAARIVGRAVAVTAIAAGGFMFYQVIVNPLWLLQVKQESLIDSVRTKLEASGEAPHSAAITRLMEQAVSEHRALIFWLNTVCTGLGAIAVYSGLLMVNAAKRSSHADLHKSGSPSDCRDQVVFFRSFESDAACREPLPGFFCAFAVETDEEQLATMIESRCRFFALGRLGEPLPELGAYRFYFAHDEWQKHALMMMRLARIVMVRPHRTPSLLWELEQVVANVDPLRFVIWIPPSMSHGDWRYFAWATETVFPQRLPEFSAEQAQAANLFSTHGWLVFTAEWQPRLAQTAPPEAAATVEGNEMKTDSATLLLAIIDRAPKVTATS